MVIPFCSAVDGIDAGVAVSRSGQELSGGFGTITRQPGYDVDVEENVMVAMRDGVRLATDIYWPVRDGRRLEGRLPVLLHRTPYDKTDEESEDGDNRWFAERGYVAVNQDCRGCYRSEGKLRLFLPEAEDGYDTLAWIKQQPWAGERVGSWGTSWSGWTQTAMAALGPDNLAAMIPNMSGSNAYTNAVRQGGALELRIVAWAFWHSALNSQAALKADPFITPALNQAAVSFRDWLTRMPIRKGQTQLRLVPPYEDWVFELMTRGDFDEFWSNPSMNPGGYRDRFPKAAALYVSGWYDSYPRATFENFLGHPKASPRRVLVGPWTHGSTTTELTYAGDVEFGEDAALPSFKELHLQWFDRSLRGLDGPEEAPVRIFVMGGGGGHKSVEGRLMHGGRWRDEQEWPLARTRWQDFYLHEDGALRQAAPETESSSTTFQFDPAHPVPSIGGNVSSLIGLLGMPPGVADPAYVPWATRYDEIMVAGGFDQHEAPGIFGCEPPYLPLGSRPDVLVFQTEPLSEDVEVTGPIDVKLWVSSSAPDTDFTAKLIDVYPPSPWYPNGYHLNLSDSILRLRYRKGDGRADFLPPGTPAEITITLYPTSNLFVRGHRIRLDIAGSNFPRFDVNPNTGEPIGRERRRRIAGNTVYHEAARPSRVTLPIIPG